MLRHFQELTRLKNSNHDVKIERLFSIMCSYAVYLLVQPC